MLAPVPDLKSEISYEGGADRITFVRSFRWAFLFFAAWLVGWWFGWINAFHQLQKLLAKHAFSFELCFMLVWMSGWTFGGGAVVVVILFGLFGTEYLELTPTEIRLRKEIFGLGFTRTFNLGSADSLQWVPAERRGRSTRSAHLQFRHEGKDISFASDIDEAEGQRLVTVLSAVIPPANVLSQGDLTLLKLS